MSQPGWPTAGPQSHGVGRAGVRVASLAGGQCSPRPQTHDPQTCDPPIRDTPICDTQTCDPLTRDIPICDSQTCDPQTCDMQPLGSSVPTSALIDSFLGKTKTPQGTGLGKGFCSEKKRLERELSWRDSANSLRGAIT